MKIITKFEQDLLSAVISPDSIIVPPSKRKDGRADNLDWMKFLKTEELIEISSVKVGSLTYVKLRNRCNSRAWRSDPINLKNQYARNKKNYLKDKLKKKEKLIQELPELVKMREEKAKIDLEKTRANSRDAYHLKKNDPEFKKKDNERCRMFRKKNPNYGKNYYHAHKKPRIKIPKTPEQIEKSMAKKRESVKNFIEKNPNYGKEYQKKWRELHPSYHKDYYELNKGSAKEKYDSKKKDKTHKKKQFDRYEKLKKDPAFIARKKEIQLKWREKNPNYQKEWREKNKRA